MSLICALVLFYVVLRHITSWAKTGMEQRIVMVTCLAAPGTMILAGMGYAVVMAMLLFMSGMLVALKSERISFLSALLGGVLIGTAIATRWPLLPALPAILLWACCSRNHLRNNIIMSLIGSVVAVISLAGFVSVQTYLLGDAGIGNEGVSVAANLRATGVSRELTPPGRMLSFVVRFLTTLPLALILLSFFGYMALKQNRRAKRLIVVMLGAALLITAAWIVRSPWMHLRYIWPVYLMVALCAGLGLAALYRMADAVGRPELRLLAVGLPVFLVFTQMLVALRVIAIGAGMQVNSAGYDNTEKHFKPFHHIQEQRAIVQQLKSFDQDTVIGTIRMPYEFGANELAFLSDRIVIDYARASEAQAQMHPDYFLVHRFSPLNLKGQAWVETLGDPAWEIRGYTLYKMPEGIALPPAKDVVLDSQLYRFSLEKNLSLTWY